jgi:hypothetical protein
MHTGAVLTKNDPLKPPRAKPTPELKPLQREEGWEQTLQWSVIAQDGGMSSVLSAKRKRIFDGSMDATVSWLDMICPVFTSMVSRKILSRRYQTPST